MSTVIHAQRYNFTFASEAYTLLNSGTGTDITPPNFIVWDFNTQLPFNYSIMGTPNTQFINGDVWLRLKSSANDFDPIGFISPGITRVIPQSKTRIRTRIDGEAPDRIFKIELTNLSLDFGSPIRYNLQHWFYENGCYEMRSGFSNVTQTVLNEWMNETFYFYFRNWVNDSVAVIRGNVNNIQAVEGKWPALMGSNADCDINGDFPMTPLIRACPRNVSPTSTFDQLNEDAIALFPIPLPAMYFMFPQVTPLTSFKSPTMPGGCCIQPHSLRMEK
ncbi:MAG: hypothetical protein ACK4GL_10580 [Flavobacteriales bacterium]